jgi:catechol 2,3-dioxygenase-like lactoylglutathione lyase family enzyme
MAKSILGIHRVTAIDGDPDPNLDTRLLGLRLVKITMNFDGPASSYRLYYGDSSGHPGTILTFFLWPGVRRIGSSQASATSLAIPSGAGRYWRERVRAHSTEFEIPQERYANFLRTSLIDEIRKLSDLNNTFHFRHFHLDLDLHLCRQECSEFTGRKMGKWFLR